MIVFYELYHCTQTLHVLAIHLPPTGYLFLVLMISHHFQPNKGSIAVVDTKSNTIIKKINSGYQPYGMAVDEQDNIIAVVNFNISGPGSHHASGCGTKNGNVVL